MTTLIAEPTVARRIEKSVTTILKSITDLGAVTINEGVIDGTVESPYISVVANRDGERVRNSGAYEYTVMIHLHTTVGDGPKASTDAELCKFDAGVEEALFEVSKEDLADVLTANAQDVRVDAVLDISSEPTSFNQQQRNITYQFSCVAIRIEPTL